MCRKILWFQQTTAAPESTCDAILDGMVWEAGSESVVGGGDKKQKRECAEKIFCYIPAFR